MAQLSVAEIEALIEEEDQEIINLDEIQKKYKKEQKKANKITKVRQYDLRD